MIKRITLENYMSHEKTVIEPGKGLTVLIGPNNCGKSAVVSALQALCFNDRRGSVIRHEQKEARVTIELENEAVPHTIRWRRKEGTAGYDIDGTPFDRLNNGLPEQLQKLLRMDTVQAGTRCIDIHFASQKTPIFLLDKTASEVAGFFSASSDAQKLMQMQRQHNRDVQDTKKDVKRMEAEAQRLAEAAGALASAASLAEQATLLEEQMQALQAGEMQASALESAIARQAGALAAQRRQRRRGAVLDNLANVPTLQNVETLEVLLSRIKVLGNKLRVSSAMRKALASLAPPPEPASTDALSTLVARLSSVQKRIFVAGAQRGALAALASPPEPADLTSIVQLGSKWKLSIAKVADVKRQVADATSQVEACMRDMRDWATANPTCPTCGAEVSAAHILGEAHG